MEDQYLTEDDLDMIIYEAAEVASEGVIAGCVACDGKGYPLNELQQIQLLKSMILSMSRLKPAALRYFEGQNKLRRLVLTDEDIELFLEHEGDVND